jgi:hypothetical protein
VINRASEGAQEVRSHDRKHIMSQSTVPPYAATDARVSTEDQGKGGRIPMQIEAC